MNLKKRLLSLVIILLLVLTGCSDSGTAKVDTGKQTYIEFDSADNDVNSVNFEKIAENEYLEFSINPDTTDIQITDKKTGYIWKSASEYENGTQGKVLELTFLNSSGRIRQPSSSYTSRDIACSGSSHFLQPPPTRPQVSESTRFSRSNFPLQVMIQLDPRWAGILGFGALGSLL